MESIAESYATIFNNSPTRISYCKDRKEGVGHHLLAWKYNQLARLVPPFPDSATE